MLFSFRLAPAGLLLALLAGCDSQRSTIESTPEISQSSPAAAPATPVSFRKELAADDLRFLVQTTGEGSSRQLSVRAEKGGRELTTTTQILDGSVADAVVTNLNDDKYPELLVFVSDAGTGSYGQLVGYEFMNQGRRAITLPALAGAAAAGYQGHDDFRVEGQELLRTFPVYSEADANCCPSSGKRTIRYQLLEGIATFRQVAFSTAAR
ncbi:hypothetical protein [Hymenobacter guriensis]|uniref:Uncharacterized protein n=1 Tax=Hymenobacter guriensis TaxID=2793065 RepID=A0ABS0L2J3_9BACT|nr:hypothetical protein [Hymenobacter guriensis]MBG8553649.1 hypothetical protein [Hymenobacter guriensis]